MSATLLLDRTAWDLVVDANGNIAVASNPYALAQDAASAIKTFQGEVYFDTTIGVPYISEIFGRTAPLSLIRQQLVDAALIVADVVSAQVFFSRLADRILAGQVQVVSSTGQVATATFTTVNPQGEG